MFEYVAGALSPWLGVAIAIWYLLAFVAFLMPILLALKIAKKSINKDQLTKLTKGKDKSSKTTANKLVTNQTQKRAYLFIAVYISLAVLAGIIFYINVHIIDKRQQIQFAYRQANFPTYKPTYPKGVNWGATYTNQYTSHSVSQSQYHPPELGMGYQAETGFFRITEIPLSGIQEGAEMPCKIDNYYADPSEEITKNSCVQAAQFNNITVYERRPSAVEDGDDWLNVYAHYVFTLEGQTRIHLEIQTYSDRTDHTMNKAEAIKIIQSLQKVQI